jgi:hypothetical protein
LTAVDYHRFVAAVHGFRSLLGDIATLTRVRLPR